MTQQKILVTGCAGFIGYHFTKLLLDDDYLVLGIDNINNYYDPALKQARLNNLKPYRNFSFEKIDIAEREQLAKIFKNFNPDKVVHLAAQAGGRYSIENPYAYLDANLTGFLNILELCRHNEVEGLIYASSSSVYGSNTKIPLRYLDCMVILGICNLNELKHVNSPLLDLETVFQTANGKERIYVMPFNSEAVMWQLSFPISETKALNLSKREIKYLKDEAVKRANWHTPIPEIIKATTEKLISGYPVYDRKPLQSDDFKQTGNITLIGDAAHPMSPFKGQGANQALLDALELSATLTKTINTYSNWKDTGLRPLLTKFETNMLKRSTVKVKDSAEAAQALHSEHILIKKNHPRGKFDKNSKNEKRPN